MTVAEAPKIEEANAIEKITARGAVERRSFVHLGQFWGFSGSDGLQVISLKVVSGALWISFGGVVLLGVETPDEYNGLMERWVLFFDPGLSVESILVRVYGSE